MTEIGKMIYEDGKSKGEEEGLIRGKAEGKAEVLIKQLAKNSNIFLKLTLIK